MPRPAPAARRAASDALDRLQARHREIEVLLDRGTRVLPRLAEALDGQAEEEEEIFYPALRKAAGPGFAPVLARAVRQHRGIHHLLGELRATPPGQARARAFEELRARILEHVRAVEKTVFPEALRRLSRPRRLALGRRMDLLAQAR